MKFIEVLGEWIVVVLFFSVIFKNTISAFIKGVFGELTDKQRSRILLFTVSSVLILSIVTTSFQRKSESQDQTQVQISQPVPAPIHKGVELI
jgi:membrane protein implicated in regulation of membrane protease activity